MEAKVERISILQSSIKTRIGNDIHQRPAKISILQSSIKTKTKKRGICPRLYFNSTKFD